MDDNVFSIINQYVQKEGPTDVEGLIAALGIRLQKSFLDSGISGMIECKNDNYIITVSSDDPVTRQRFTMAHELGHFIYHKDKIGEGIGDDRAYRSTRIGAYLNTKIGPHEEIQANKFAASILMPKDKIDALIGKGKEEAEIAKYLQVSEQALKIRVANLKPSR